MRILSFRYLLFMLLFIASGFCEAESTFIDKMSITKTTNKDNDQQTYSTIRITYPIIKNIPHANALNKEIKHTIDQIVVSFKKQLTENQPLRPIADLPLTVDSNVLDIHYKIFHATKDVLSIRFSIYTNFYGAAHPFTTFQSLNYDASKKKVLSLHDIFQSNDYLQLLSTYSKKILTKKLSNSASAHTEPDTEGLKPTAKNFSIWNMTPSGLLLTFPPYQVAAYVFGPQEVLVPYSTIQPMLRPIYQASF